MFKIPNIQYGFFTVTCPNMAQIIGSFKKTYLDKNYCKKENYEIRWF